ncbi:uncharacterized protein J3R85_015123 [Psidium guajava]|nr:uncharacterized protein J3R85_015123 [Psidium guajava]
MHVKKLSWLGQTNITPKLSLSRLRDHKQMLHFSSKNLVTAQLAVVLSQDKYITIMEQLLAGLKGFKSTSSRSYHSGDTNEDNCHGINLFEDDK